ncbi:hypothetical protein KUTeg_008537 [Tegillarca granosa]|uniref:RRM domain-containing protein n=1 Tax=Tegillarca granosa TaxID=220873 RepID=A0ABQ9FCM9_TEGGR|nr:hypothetical protein KUTeg_008537 [Tegillarca granosa]
MMEMIFSGHHRYIPEVLPIHTIHVQGQVLFTDLQCIIDQGQGHTQEVTENENAHTHGQGVVVTIETDIADLVQEVHIIKDDQEGLEAEGYITHVKQKKTSRKQVFCLVETRFCFYFQQDNPEASSCLGVFGLSLYTQERDLREVFDRYGPIEECNVVYDRQSGRSRGFAFITFRNTDDAIEVKEDMEDDDLLHHIIVEEVVGTPDLGQGQDLIVLVSIELSVKEYTSTSSSCGIEDFFLRLSEE